MEGGCEWCGIAPLKMLINIVFIVLVEKGDVRKGPRIASSDKHEGTILELCAVYAHCEASHNA